MRVKEQTLGLARTNHVGLGCRGGSAAVAQDWLGTEGTAEIQEILRQDELAFRSFVAVSVVICALILAAMFLA